MQSPRNPGLLNDPASTVALIGLNAVVGVKGQVENGTAGARGIHLRPLSFNRRQLVHGRRRSPARWLA
jgi:hypothetical protein